MVMLCDIVCAYDLAAIVVVAMDGGGGNPLADPKRGGRPEGEGMARGEEMWDILLVVVTAKRDKWYPKADDFWGWLQD